MSQLTGTTNLLYRLRGGDEQARGELISHACERLRRLASRILGDYPGVRRWEQTDDVLQNALVRLCRALETATPLTSLHFYNLAAQQIRWELNDLRRHYQGPQGHGANHHTDGGGRAADDPGGVYSRHAVCRGEPSSAAEWAAFLKAVELLPEKQRAVVDLVWVQGMMQEEAAKSLAVSLRTVQRRLRAAKLSLAGIPS
jgi:RNA polymerase sigma-70 factor (ECF subfamily)